MVPKKTVGWKKTDKDTWVQGNKEVSVWKGKYGQLWRFNRTTKYKTYSANFYDLFPKKSQAMKKARDYMKRQ